MRGRGVPDSGHDADEEGDPSAIVEEVLARVNDVPPGAPAVAGLNPEAGSHRVTSDPRELRAALLAGEKTRRRFGYYERRYGERGRRFTHSDSAWIVTLAGMPAAVVEQQLRWLGALLAARGMPRWLLEEHVEALHTELVNAVPEKRADYDKLLEVARVFRRERLSQIDTAAADDLAEAFDRRVGAAAAGDLPEAGALVVAAVAEERAGLERVVDSLMEWLADPDRFPAEWVQAVGETVEALRECPAGAAGDEDR